MFPSEQEFYTRYRKYGLTTLYHLIVPPKKHGSRKPLPNIYNVKRSLMKYFDDIFIVRGADNGLHYHAIGHLKKGVHRDEVPTRFYKFALRKIPLQQKGLSTFNLEEERQDEDRRAEVEHHKVVRSTDPLRHYDLILFCLRHLIKIKKRARAREIGPIQRAKTNSKKQFHIMGVYDYLVKNHNENNTQELYITYLIN